MQLYMIQGNKIYLRIRHWSFLHTEASYFTICALCSGVLNASAVVRGASTLVLNHILYLSASGEN